MTIQAKRLGRATFETRDAEAATGISASDPCRT
jgi:hypothetical protein